MNTLKRKNAMQHYQGFKGDQTLRAIEAQIPDDLAKRLTGAAYGMVMSAINQAYQNGRAAAGCESIDDGNAIWCNKGPGAPAGMMITLDDPKGGVVINRHQPDGEHDTKHYIEAK